MKAVFRTHYGSPDVLEYKEVAKPEPEAEEVLVKVHATTVNRTDCGILRGKPFIFRFFIGLLRPKKEILGTDFAGVVEAVGSEVRKFKKGDKVFGFYDEGLCSQAEYLAINHDKEIAMMPKKISFEQAAASLEGAHYAYNFVKKVAIKKGTKVLVNGGTGAIGSAAIQILKYMEADIIATSSTKHLKLVKSLGAQKVIDYTKEDFTELDEEFDLVFDAVGKSSFGKCKKIMKPEGIYISSELGWMAENVFYALFTPLFGRKKVMFPLPTDVKGSIRFITKLIEEGKFKAVIDRKYVLKDIAKAYRYVETGEKIGNVVIHVK